MKLLAAPIGTLVVALLLGCESAPPDGDGLQGRLVLTGSSTVAPVAGQIARRFEALHPGVRIDVQTGGSSRGIADARDGSADIGMASRALKEGESDLTPHTIARDGLALIVHRDNPITGLDMATVRSIYTGATDAWSAVGGGDGPIAVVSKASGRATLEVFLKFFELEEGDIAAAVIIGDNQEAIKTVAGNPRAIAYVSIGAAEYEAGHGAAIRLIELDGVEPSTAAVADGSYPVYRPLNLITAGEPGEVADAFLRFARSEAAHPDIEAMHFVPAR